MLKSCTKILFYAPKFCQPFIKFLSFTDLPGLNAPFKLYAEETIKNIPNSRFNTLPLKILTESAPNAVKIQAGIMMYAVYESRTRWLRKCTAKAKIDIGKNAMRFIHCALFCPILNMPVSMGIRRLPPPKPIPPIIPAAAPAIKSPMFFVRFHLFLIKTNF